MAIPLGYGWANGYVDAWWVVVWGIVGLVVYLAGRWAEETS
jgi:hypothetical protein